MSKDEKTPKKALEGDRVSCMIYSVIKLKYTKQIIISFMQGSFAI